MKWWLIIFGVLSNAAANAVLKYAMSQTGPQAQAFSFSLSGNIPLLAGIGLYGIAFILYALVLKTVPLNVAYPILTSGAMMVVALISICLFKEPFTWKTTVGMLFIICGVFFISQK